MIRIVFYAAVDSSRLYCPLSVTLRSTTMPPSPCTSSVAARRPPPPSMTFGASTSPTGLLWDPIELIHEFFSCSQIKHHLNYFVDRTWSRPLSTGTYPSPKACSVMVLHPRHNCLLLFGGWTHPRSVRKNYAMFESAHLRLRS